jgi:crossover junction endodeoxyribonuclease RuvC
MGEEDSPHQGDFMTLYLGIDPGLNGAIAIIDHNLNIIDLMDCPVNKIKTGKSKIVNLKKTEQIKTEVNGKVIYEVLLKYRGACCVIEKAQAMPQQGVVSMFNYGLGYGKYVMGMESLDMTYKEVPPGLWKSKFNLSSDKEESTELARKLLDKEGKYVYLKKHDGRAEALLLALYSRNHVYNKGEK